ncbi:MAG: hypothetical protein LBR85_06630 [Oscillospiraceae bacterium]|jgi:hypothetical protein|nr:hypothetical protein [Oscillospiraceae bacterium]
MKRLSILIALAISLLLPACTPASPVGTVTLSIAPYNKTWGLYGLPYVVTYTDKTGEMPIDEVAEEMVGLLIEELKNEDSIRSFAVLEGSVEELSIMYKDDFEYAWANDRRINRGSILRPSKAGDEYWVVSGSVNLKWSGELGAYGTFQGDSPVSVNFFTNGINRNENEYTMSFWEDARTQGDFLTIDNVTEFTDVTGGMPIEEVAITMIKMLIEDLKTVHPARGYTLIEGVAFADDLTLTSKAEIEAREGISKPIPEAGDEYWGVTCPVYLKWDGSFGILQNYMDAFSNWEDYTYVTPEGITLFKDFLYAYGINKVGNTYTMSQWPALVI